MKSIIYIILLSTLLIFSTSCKKESQREVPQRFIHSFLKSSITENIHSDTEYIFLPFRITAIPEFSLENLIVTNLKFEVDYKNTTAIENIHYVFEDSHTRIKKTGYNIYNNLIRVYPSHINTPITLTLYANKLESLTENDSTFQKITINIIPKY